MKFLLLLLMCPVLLAAAPPTLVTVQGAVTAVDGSTYRGSVIISNRRMVCSGVTVPANTITVPVVNGAVSVQLYATSECGQGQSYTVRYKATSGAENTAYWIIPASPTTTTVVAVEGLFEPTPITTVLLQQLSVGSVSDGQFLQRSGTSWVGANGVSAVSSVFGRTGAVTAQSADYAGFYAALSHVHLISQVSGLTESLAGKEPIDPTILRSGNSYSNPTWLASLAYNKLTGAPTIPSNTSQIAESGNLYFTTGRAQAAMAGLYQTPITLGNTGQYLRGDLSLATFPTIPTNTSQITESGNLYYTDARVRAAVSAGSGIGYDSGTGVISSLSPLISSGTVAPTSTPSRIGNVYIDTVAGKAYTAVCSTSSACWSLSGAVASVFGRTGAVTAQSGDYSSFYQSTITGAPSTWPAFGAAALLNVGTTAGTVAAGDDSRMTNSRTPTTHATSHQNGGSDEVATATPGANAIPKAGAGGTLAAGWIPTLNQSTTGNAATATALVANGANCSAGYYPLGVDASGAAESCTAASGGTSVVNYAVIFSSATSVTTLGTTHNLGSANLIGECWDSATPRNRVEGWTATVHPTTYDMVVAFPTTFSGTCVFNAASGVGVANYPMVFSAATSVTTLGTTHNLGSANLVAACWDNATPRNRVEGWTATVHPTTYDVTVTFPTAFTGTCPLNAAGSIGGSSGGGGGTGDVVGPSVSVDSEVALFNSTTGKLIKRASATGVAKLTSGVLGVVSGNSTDCVLVNGSSGACGSGGSVTAGTGISVSGSIVSVDTAAVPSFLAGSATIDFASISASSCAIQTLTMTGAVTGDAVIGGWPADMSTGIIPRILVSAANTVQIQLCNVTGGAIDPPSRTYGATIVRSF